MAGISVEQQPDGSFRVEVSEGGRSTSHTVTVPDDYPRALGCEHVERRELVQESFSFLLEREPSTSILRSFRLSQIADYFPEYADEMRRRLGKGT